MSSTWMSSMHEQDVLIVTAQRIRQAYAGFGIPHSKPRRQRHQDDQHDGEERPGRRSARSSMRRRSYDDYDTGTLIRTSIAGISEMGRNTQGVRIIHIREDDEVSTVTEVDPFHEEDEDQPEIDDQQEAGDQPVMDDQQEMGDQPEMDASED